MIALGIIILILLLIILFPVGVDAAYIDGTFTLKAKAGPIKIGIIPGKEKEGEKEKKEKKPKKEKKKKSNAALKDGSSKKSKTKLKLSFDDIMTIVRIALRTLGRFRRSISVDKLMIHLVTAGPDPYSAVMNYGYFNAALGALQPFIHKAFKIKDEDYASAIDFEGDKPKVDGRIVLTVRIGEILLVVLCAAFAFLKWFLSFRRRNKAFQKSQSKEAAAKTNDEKITENSSAEKGN